MEFSRQEYWSGLPFLTPGNLPDPGIKPASPVSPALESIFFTTEPPEKPKDFHRTIYFGGCKNSSRCLFFYNWYVILPLKWCHFSPSYFSLCNTFKCYYKSATAHCKFCFNKLKAEKKLFFKTNKNIGSIGPKKDEKLGHLCFCVGWNKYHQKFPFSYLPW